MRWHDLLADLDAVEFVDATGVEVTSITNDSRRVAPGACYACIPGARVDGHDFAPDAVRAGAVALLAERLVDRNVVGHVAQARVPVVRDVLGPVASKLYGHPSRSMRCLGVTGTNGKTTTAFLLEAIALAAGDTPGVIGTLGARVDGAPFASEQATPTTPEACDLQRLLDEMRRTGVGTVAMEVSSHALDRREVDGTRFAAVCFTNLSHEHLDYHGSVDAYFAAKARLFDGAFAPAAAVNVDDAAGRLLAERAAGSGTDVWTYGWEASEQVPDLSAAGIAAGVTGSTFSLIDRRAGTALEVRTPLVGSFNVSNALAAAATARAAGFGLDAIADGLAAVRAIPGRVERIDRGQDFTVLVDYAHTPDALTRLLRAARGLVHAAGDIGRVVTVFGCGGDRDRAKRPLMGRAVGAAADVAVLTSDNPRSESPDAIAAEVMPGLRAGSAEVVVELDRRAAIRHALREARAGDVVVLAGKGHETGQTVGARTLPFDDRLVAGDELEALGWT